MRTQVVESTHTLGDYIYDAVFVAGIGGGMIALFFLAFDTIAYGQPFLTPTLMGKVLFEGVAPASVQTVDMMAVVRYSLVHIAAFGLLGLGISFVVHQAEIRSRHPIVVIGVVFAIIEVAFWLAITFALPGVLERLGQLPVILANLIAAVGVAAFFIIAHRREQG
jgi:hypothetical protein